MREATYDDAILADDNMVAYGCSLDDAIRADMDVVSDFHRVVVEVTAVGFVWWPGFHEQGDIRWCEGQHTS